MSPRTRGDAARAFFTAGATAAPSAALVEPTAAAPDDDDECAVVAPGAGDVSEAALELLCFEVYLWRCGPCTDATYEFGFRARRGAEAGLCLPLSALLDVTPVEERRGPGGGVLSRFWALPLLPEEDDDGDEDDEAEARSKARGWGAARSAV